MADAKIWHPGDPCANCGGVVGLVPLPTPDERKAADDVQNRVPVPAYKDTAPSVTVDEHGRLYRCRIDGFSIRTKEPAPVDPLQAALGALAASDASLKASLETQAARIDALRSEHAALQDAHATLADQVAAAPPTAARG